MHTSQNTLKLEAMCELIADCPHSTPVWTDNGVIVLRSPNIRNGRLDLSDKSFTDEAHYQDRTHRAIPSGGDLVITREAPMGEVCMIPDGLKCCLGQRMVLLRPDRKRVNGKYLLYALQSPFVRHQILWAEGTGSTVSNLRIPSLKALDIPAPAKTKQDSIAHILSTLDDKIELNRKMNQTLEAMARAIFKSWFVDFDPVRAKAEGRDTGLPADVAALFPDSFEDSELGDIPKGWRVMPVGEALKAVGGSTPSTANSAFWESGEFHWATPKDLSGLSAPILVETERKITKAGVEEISSGLLPIGTVLMSSRAPVGYLALSAMPVAVNQGFIAMICDGPISNFYALNWCHYNMEEIQQRASGTTFAEISKAAFRPILILVPSDTIMKRFTQIVEPLYKSIEERVRESRTLAALRDALLPRLLSGEIRVKDATHCAENQE